MFMQKLKSARTIAFITLAAFLLNALLPFFAVYNTAAYAADVQVSASDSLESVLGEKILICTSEGFKWVSLADLKHQKEKPHPEFKCAVCYVAAHLFEFDLPALYEVAANIELISYRAQFAAAKQFIKISLAKHKRSRAPPVVTTI